MSYCGIYTIQSRTNPKRVYIGNSANIDRRWRIHINDLKGNKHHSIKLQRHFNKYGLCDLMFNIICECDKINLISIEQFYIDACNPYFNCSPTAGSTLGTKRTPEQILRSMGRKHTEEAKHKMSESRRGKKQSLETIEKGRLSRIGRILSDETKAKIAKAHIGMKQSPESIEKTRKANLGRKNPHTLEQNLKISLAQKGRKLTEEHKAKLRKAKIGHIPWNKGKKTGHEPWNKGKKGVQISYRKGKKKINGSYIYVNGN